MRVLTTSRIGSTTRRNVTKLLRSSKIRCTSRCRLVVEEQVLDLHPARSALQGVQWPGQWGPCAPCCEGVFGPARGFHPGPPDAGATAGEGTWFRASRRYSEAQKYPASPPRVHSTKSNSTNITSNRASVP